MCSSHRHANSFRRWYEQSQETGSVGVKMSPGWTGDEAVKVIYAPVFLKSPKNPILGKAYNLKFLGQ